MGENDGDQGEKNPEHIDDIASDTDLGVISKKDPEWQRRRGIMASSCYQEWKDEGLTGTQVIELTTYLLQLVSNDIEKQYPVPPETPDQKYDETG